MSWSPLCCCCCCYQGIVIMVLSGLIKPTTKTKRKRKRWQMRRAGCIIGRGTSQMSETKLWPVSLSIDRARGSLARQMIAAFLRFLRRSSCHCSSEEEEEETSQQPGNHESICTRCRCRCGYRLPFERRAAILITPVSKFLSSRLQFAVACGNLLQ
jgi:hypothetical protein